MANEAFSLKSASVWWAGWATVTYGMVGKLKTRVGKRKNFSALRAKFCPPWPETLPAPLLSSRYSVSLRAKHSVRSRGKAPGQGISRGTKSPEADHADDFCNLMHKFVKQV